MPSKLALPVIVSAVLIAQASPLSSQTKGFSSETSAEADQYGLRQVVIRNKSKLQITAAFITHSCSGPEQHVTAVGFDNALNFMVGSLGQDPGIAPSGQRTFEFADADANCQQGISVIFSDGHCEGPAEGSYGCGQLMADRRLAYTELADIRSFVMNISEQDDQYIAKMQADLESRRVAHSHNTREESDGRMKVLQALKMKFPPYTTPPAELSTPAQTVKTLDTWMARLATNIVVPAS